MPTLLSPTTIATVDLSQLKFAGARCPLMIGQYQVPDQFGNFQLSLMLGQDPEVINREMDPSPVGTLTVNLVNENDRPIPSGWFGIKTWSENIALVDILRQTDLFIEADSKLMIGNYDAVVEFWRLNPEAKGLDLSALPAAMRDALLRAR